MLNKELLSVVFPSTFISICCIETINAILSVDEVFGEREQEMVNTIQKISCCSIHFMDISA